MVGFGCLWVFWVVLGVCLVCFVIATCTVTSLNSTKVTCAEPAHIAPPIVQKKRVHSHGVSSAGQTMPGTYSISKSSEWGCTLASRYAVYKRPLSSACNVVSRGIIWPCIGLGMSGRSRLTSCSSVSIARTRLYSAVSTWRCSLAVLL